MGGPLAPGSAPPQGPLPPSPPAGQATTASGRPSPSSIAKLRAELDEDIKRIERENGEIDMLMEQVLAEIERHEYRRTKMETRLATLEASAAPEQQELDEARDALLALTRREFLFDAQRQVLQGKQRGLARFLQRLVEIDNSLESITGMPSRPAPAAMPGLRALASAGSGGDAPGLNQPALQMRSQEDLRREIVRLLHDGPTQSIANIGLQAEIVERLVKTNDERAISELENLRQLVQQALDATKEFIFEVRPMVLDDLGLGPTIRRAAADRGRRAGISVDFDSQGSEERIAPDLESALFRSIDEAIAGYILLEPPSVVVRLDWTDREVTATVEGTWSRVRRDDDSPDLAIAATRAGETPAVLLAMMEEERSQEREAKAASRSLSPHRITEIGNRARALGMTLTMRDAGQTMELVAPIVRENR
ncbi:MAG: sensor histidine kinase [Chloroflexota bacterium]